MSFDALGRYTANHKVWDHVGNIIPDVEHSEGERPAHKFKVAPWLPVQFYDKHFENWVVVMPGKILALDPAGDLMPAEYGLTSATVTYTANDVAAGVIDVATGEPVTTAKTVTLSQLSGVRGGGWTAATAGDSQTSGFMGRFGVSFADATRKYPVGVAPYAYLQWAGGDGFDPSQYDKHNYNMQHQVAVLCDYVLALPLVPGVVASESVSKTMAGASLVLGTPGVHTNAQIRANSRYNATTGTVKVRATDRVVAIALDNTNIAPNTDRTLIVLSSDNTSDDVSGVLLNEVGSVAAVVGAGDFFVDTVAGVIFIYDVNGTAMPTSMSGAAGNLTIRYYHYAVAPTTLAKFTSVLASTSTLQPGDFLKVGTESNFVYWNPASDNAADLIGQVIAIDNNYDEGLAKVRTAYSPALGTDSSGSMSKGVAGSASANLGQLDQMPGSATKGYTDKVTFAGAADQVVIVNLIGR